MKKILIAILLALALVLVPVSNVMAPDYAEVEITALPEYLAMTNSVDAWTIGPVAKETTKWWTADGLEPDPWPTEATDMKSTIENTGSITSDVDIEAIDFTGGAGWTLVAASPGGDQVVLAAGITGCIDEAAMLELIDVTPQELIDSIIATGTVKWFMKLETGTFSDGVAKTSTVTLTIKKHV